MNEVIVKIEKQEEFSRFLTLHGFQVEELDNQVYQVTRDGELPVFVKISETSIYFEVDLGNLNAFGSSDLHFKLLDLNTEILPVSFGINNTNPEDPRLVLVESRETGSLNDHEILSVFDALELATDRAEVLLTQHIA
ncbi:hypothetical protein [Pelagicoccus sp. SDUM812003]|uniref:hypothetical protein n=1 Tax=Pelagicoccus sp. SDUM812003 TaxID=3041267 RepID=UPI00280FD224|nr:hypothetical protein [Pelagicoccus sp. SDUM812003]MDQ8204207.1 hypothetical protein [Pelagicoccus sp. SDUM812003]